MHVLALLALLCAAVVRAEIYVTNPVQSSSCVGGQSCQVQWVDNGVSPSLSSIGNCNVAVYTGNYILVQSLPAVDVSTVSSFTFTPDASVAADGQFYIVFSSTSISYTGFSASFTLTGMTGTTPASGSSSPATSGTPTVSPSGTSSPSGTPTTSPTTTLSTGTTPSSASTTAPTSTLATTLATTPTTTASTTPTTTLPTTASSSTASSTPTSAAGRVASSVSFGALAVIFALTGALVY